MFSFRQFLLEIETKKVESKKDLLYINPTKRSHVIDIINFNREVVNNILDEDIRVIWNGKTLYMWAGWSNHSIMRTRQKIRNYISGHYLGFKNTILFYDVPKKANGIELFKSFERYRIDNGWRIKSDYMDYV